MVALKVKTNYISQAANCKESENLAQTTADSGAYVARNHHLVGNQNPNLLQTVQHLNNQGVSDAIETMIGTGDGGSRCYFVVNITGVEVEMRGREFGGI